VSAIEKITSELDYQLGWADWHKERGNVESAAIHRGTAAGLKRAMEILAAAESETATATH
jgi:hypothetical protein